MKIYPHFEKAYDRTHKNEGFYANNPNDRGGETYCGISRRFHPDWEGWKIVDSYEDKDKLKHDKVLNSMVRVFFEQNYWEANKFQYIDFDLLAMKLYDIGVNADYLVSQKLFQRSLNFLGADLKVDGILGRKTFGAYNSLDFEDKVNCLKTLSGLQINYYVEITEKRSDQKCWSRNWLGRV